MYSDLRLVLLFLAVFVWFLVLSYFIWKQNKFLGDFFPSSGERDIRRKFQEVMQSLGKFKLDLGDFENRLKEIQRDSSVHIQRIELLRFNPYEDTGGDISFCIALLDSQGTGVVISSLHSRSGTRVFAKEVISGKMGKHEFSKEEIEVVKKAMR